MHVRQNAAAARTRRRRAQVQRRLLWRGLEQRELGALQLQQAEGTWHMRGQAACKTCCQWSAGEGCAIPAMRCRPGSRLSVQQPASARTWSSKRGLLRCCSLGRPLMGVPASRSAARTGVESKGRWRQPVGSMYKPCVARSQTHAHGAGRHTHRATCSSCAAQQGASRQRGTRTECRDGWLAVCPSAARCAAAAAGLQPVRLSATVHTGAAAAGWPAHSGMRPSD